jgi:cell division protein FtsZ
MQFDMPNNEDSIIKVIGVGGGGSNAVNHMFRQGIKGVDFYIANTDQQALDISPIPNKIQLGMQLTQGRGAGSIAAVGQNAVLENIDEIRELLSDGTKMLFVTAGMGGGTGTGAAPVIAKTAKEMGILTVGIVTYPFAFEGRKRSKQADEGLEELRDNVDTLLVISNDKLREIHGNLSLKDAFAKADDILTTASKGIADIINKTGYINVDFEDVRTVMTDSGVAIMGLAKAEGEGRAIKAAQEALSSPLLNDNNIEGANYILLNITSGSEEVMMDEITDITDYIQEEAGSTAEIIWGNGTDEDLGDSICVTLIATGFQSNKEMSGISNSTQRAERKVVHQLKEEPKAPEVQVEQPAAKTEETSSELPEGWEVKKADEPVQTQITEEPVAEDKPEVKKYNLYDDYPEGDSTTTNAPVNQWEDTTPSNDVSVDVEEEQPEEIVSSAEAEVTEEQVEDSPFAQELTEEEQMRKSQERIAKIKAMSMKMKNPSGIEDLENTPAYIRRNVKLDQLGHSSESNVSRFTLGEDDDLRSNNSFLHDNVD